MAAEMGLDRAIAGFAQMAADAERRSERFAELQERMTALTSTESGAGGRVSVTVDSSGIPTSIDLAPGVRDMDPRMLSAEILSCMRRAQGKLRPSVAGLVHDIVGEDPAGTALVEGFDRRFPEPEETVPPVQDFGPPQTDRFPPPAATPVPPRHPATPPVWGSATPPAEQSQPRKYDRDRVVTPDEPDEEDEYYRRKSWLV
ncbi:YbaB/EbfC family nucleoid-associated protein [Nocardia carnea]|uniref:YbaB/EbfC family nucleoid-associated protein n=1 Tax=Nocardia carnea TaxID=37328 RepID=UPI0024576AF6|nr:YbaB/EbfC family nucleoid-associated protein [Nocardia carnea]